jgi:hypothetical protein
MVAAGKTTELHSINYYSLSLKKKGGLFRINLANFPKPCPEPSCDLQNTNVISYYLLMLQINIEAM